MTDLPMHDDHDAVHAPRREPATPNQPVDLVALADEVLAQAAGLDAGRAARTLTPGAGAPLKQAILALTAGSQLHEHRAPGPATIQVLRGQVRLRAGATTVTLTTGQWAPIPDTLHDVVADADATMLLTVAPGAVAKP